MALYLLFLALLIPGAGYAQPSRQYKLEAAFLYNFFNYITWPGYDSPEALENPIICIERDDPIGPYLRYIKQHIQGERSLGIRNLGDGESAAGCHLLFRRYPLRSQHELSKNTLTVYESDNDLVREGMIELAPEEERMVMVIYNSVMSARGFKVSSRLLDLAEIR